MITQAERHELLFFSLTGPPVTRFFSVPECDADDARVYVFAPTLWTASGFGMRVSPSR